MDVTSGSHDHDMMAQAKVPKSMDTTRIPWRANLALTATVLAIYCGFFFSASLLAAGHLDFFVCAAAAFVIVTPTLWGLVHEGIHGRLLPGRGANRAAARALSILLGFSFETVQLGHLLHHRYNGHEFDRPDRMKRGEPAWRGWLRHWAHLLGAHYLFTCLAGWVSFVPTGTRELLLQRTMAGNAADMVGMRGAALRWCGDPRRIARIRVDCIGSAALWLLVATHYAALWAPFLLTAYGRAVVYSVLDNLPHYGMHWRGDDAAKNLALPKWAAVLVLNHNLHRLHHQRPNLPWRALSTLATSSPLDGNYLSAALRQFSGPAATPRRAVPITPP
jgi:fatty acid desaturase